MKKTLQFAFRAILLVILLTAGFYFLALLMGGGLGAKPPLPQPFAEATRPLYFAHRAGAGVYPENSLGALMDAKASGFVAAEIDVRALADGELIVFHDHNTKRMLGFDGEVADLRLGQLREKSLVLDGHATDQVIPTLDEAIDAAQDMLLYIDVKHDGPISDIALADAIGSTINELGLQDRICVASHRILFIAYLEYTNPRIITTLQDVHPTRTSLLGYVPTKFRPDLLASRLASATPELREWLSDSDMMNRYITYHIEDSLLPAALDMGIEMLMVRSLSATR